MAVKTSRVFARLSAHSKRARTLAASLQDGKDGLLCGCNRENSATIESGSDEGFHAIRTCEFL